MNRKLLLAIVAILTIAAVEPARAQLVNPFGTETVGLSAEDSARLRAALRAVLQQYALGARQSWESANQKRAGTVTITRIYSRDGMRCAMVQHEFTRGPGHPYHAPLCEVASDQWRIAF